MKSFSESGSLLIGPVRSARSIGLRLPFLAAFVFCAAHAGPAEPGMLFDAEFDGTTADFFKASNINYPHSRDVVGAWRIDNGIGDPDNPSNPVHEILLNRNVSLSDGMLHILASNEKYYPTWVVNPTPFDYTTGRIESERTFTHGYFEIRGRLPFRRGLSPQLWLFNKAKQGEIDIVEGDGSPLFGSNVYYWADTPRTGISAFVDQSRPRLESVYFMRGVWHRPETKMEKKAVNYPLATTAVDGAFHTYGVDWQTGGITFYYDGQPYFQTNRSFDAPMYLIIDLALGDAGGAVTDATPFPSTMDIDYVRVYESAAAAVRKAKGVPVLQMANPRTGAYELPEHKFLLGDLPWVN